MKASDIFDGEFDVIIIGRKNGKTRKFTADRGVDFELTYEPKYESMEFLGEPFICLQPRSHMDRINVTFSILPRQDNGKFSVVKDRGDE